MAEGGSADLDRLLSAVHTLAPLIRAHADENEQQRRLSPPVVTALAEAGLFRMYTPRALGGLEVDPLTSLKPWHASTGQPPGVSSLPVGTPCWGPTSQTTRRRTSLGVTRRWSPPGASSPSGGRRSATGATGSVGAGRMPAAASTVPGSSVPVRCSRRTTRA
jgi:alkylation response protein AidB-like acyl-CoA dehydrogenase